jgi:phospholipid/cholesterol/gamma-HCH transport system permease protein
MSFTIEKLDARKSKITFSGRLDIDNVAGLWRPCLADLDKLAPQELIVDLKTVDYCDGSGIALLRTLHQRQLAKKYAFRIENFRDDFKKIFDHIEEQPNKVVTEDEAVASLPEHVGHIAYNIFEDFKQNIVFLGSLAYQFGFVLFHPQKVRWRDFWRITEDTGPRAFLIVALIGFLIGLISTFQAAPSFGEFGAQIFMINLVGLGLVREMGPLLTAVLLAGRTASSFAAEIGTMKINQEIDALSTMGLNAVRFLVVPRILATMSVTVLLEAFLVFFGLLGCYAVMSTLGYTLDAFLHQLYQSVGTGDCIGGIAKVFVFGWVIAGVGCLNGLKTRFGAQAVGRATTEAVVSSLIMLVVVDGIFAVVYYVLDI